MIETEFWQIFSFQVNLAPMGSCWIRGNDLFVIHRDHNSRINCLFLNRRSVNNFIHFNWCSVATFLAWFSAE